MVIRTGPPYQTISDEVIRLNVRYVRYNVYLELGKWGKYSKMNQGVGYRCM